MSEAIRLRAVYGFTTSIDGRPTPVHVGDVIRADDPLVEGHRHCFVELVEQATAAPGEQRGA